MHCSVCAHCAVDSRVCGLPGVHGRGRSRLGSDRLRQRKYALGTGIWNPGCEYIHRVPVGRGAGHIQMSKEVRFVAAVTNLRFCCWSTFALNCYRWFRHLCGMLDGTNTCIHQYRVHNPDGLWGVHARGGARHSHHGWRPRSAISAVRIEYESQKKPAHLPERLCEYIKELACDCCESFESLGLVRSAYSESTTPLFHHV